MTDVLDRIGDQLEHAERELWRSTTPRRVGHRRAWRFPHGRWSRSRLFVVLAVIGVSGTAGGIAIAESLSTTAINPQAWVNGQRVAPEATIAPDQAADLEILRRPRVASDALTPGDVQLLTATPAAANGANVELSRRAQGITNGAAWLIPGDAMICFVYDNPPAGGGGTCQPDASVSNGQFPVETGGSIKAPGMTSVAGVVPDGVPQVTLNISDGTTVTVPVHENVYLATIHGGLTSVTYTGTDGPVTLDN
jgi:hypothetical protein